MGVVFDAVSVVDVFGDGLADVEEEGAGAAGGVVNLDGFAVFYMVGDDFGDEDGNLVRRVELARFFACVGGEHPDEILVDEAEDIVALAAVHGDVFDEV